MAKYVVPMTTWANISVEVEIPDGVTDPETIAELTLEAFQGVSLCNGCTGHRNSGLDVGDEFELVTDEDGSVIMTKVD